MWVLAIFHYGLGHTALGFEAIFLQICQNSHFRGSRTTVLHMAIRACLFELHTLLRIMANASTLLL